MRAVVVLILTVACGRIGFDPFSGGPVDASGQLRLTAGGNFTCVAREDGSAWCWGDGRHGQLGHGAFEVTTAPVQVQGLADLTAITAGIGHACALDDRGNVSCWGGNAESQLAQPPTTGSAIPVLIASLPEVITAISAGAQHTCALANDQTLWCWGLNDAGQIGPGGMNVDTPVQVLDRVVEVSAAESFTCARRDDSSIWCWGDNEFGQLGDGTMTDRSDPQPIPGLTASQVSCGDKHCCVLDVAGEYSCWGYNNSGELGNGSEASSSTPSPFSTSADFAAISGGNDHTCAVTRAGEVKCWGLNADGQAGTGEVRQRQKLRPANVLVSGRFVAVAPGGLHTCGARDDGAIFCWGYGSMGQLANGIRAEWAPRQVSLPAGMVQGILVGDYHACALVAGSVYCWGDDVHGELGTDAVDERSATPQLVIGLSGVDTVAAGSDHTCASDAAGDLHCWGNNVRGQLGDGTVNNHTIPFHTSITGVSGVVAGNNVTCVITGPTLRCWGANEFGQLGGAVGGNMALTPITVSEVVQPFTVSIGLGHLCASTTGNVAWCWGKNMAGQLGIGTTSAIEIPTQVPGTFSQVTTGDNHSCGINGGNNTMCWGQNSSGQLGDATTIQRRSPVAVTLPSVTTGLAAGANHTCATTSPLGYCWGENLVGQLGDGTGADTNVPVGISGGMMFTELAAGFTSTCGIDTMSKVWCWGDNARGQVGIGTFSGRSTPIEVTLP